MASLRSPIPGANWKLRITMREIRRDNPHAIDREEIAAIAAEGARVIVQYSKRCYSENQLGVLNELAGVHGQSLAIRFYGHYSDEFDASVLRFLPNAQCVLMDCLMKATGLEALSHLHNLTELSLGVFELKDPDVLAFCASQSLKNLRLGDTRQCSIDLSYLSRCIALEEFCTAGHVRNIGSACHPSLRQLSLRSVKRKDDLDFVSTIPNLEALQIVLGGRSSIAEVNVPFLRKLEVVRVRGLADLGELGRFELLEELAVEDQIQLTELRVGPNPRLKTVRIVNCKTLSAVAGLTELPALSELRVYKTAIDYESFSQALPGSLKTFGFYTGKTGDDANIRMDLNRRGYSEFVERDAQQGVPADRPRPVGEDGG